MFELIEAYANKEFLISALSGIAAFATIITLGLPYVSGDRLASRLESVANRRKELREKQKAELSKDKTQLRQSPVSYMKQTVDKLNLETLLDAEGARTKLARAGFRGQKPLITFMFFRLAMPFILFAVTFLYLMFLNLPAESTNSTRFLYASFAFMIGFYAPNIYIENVFKKRQESVKSAFPDALDLLLICVESGMSIEAAFNRVADEIGAQSIEMAEEMSLTTAELSYLTDRRLAYENLADRTGLEGVKAVSTSLIQAERYGTPLASALRVMAQENRDMRMQAAEKKAAALPAKLTVPMIVFFLPVLFVVILAPAVLKALEL